MKDLLLHCGGRGVRGEDLFLTPKHFEYFLGLLVKFSMELDVVIIAYCLMTNHYHLLLLVPEEVRTRFFRRLNTAYAMFFNKFVDHPGHVFDPRFWWYDRSSKDQLGAVGSYIPLNPVGPGLVKLPHEYPYSSFAASVGLRPKPEWLGDEILLNLFSQDRREAKLKYRQFVESHIDIRLSAYALAERVSGLCCSGVRAPKMREQIELLAFASESIERAYGGKLPMGMKSPDLMLHCMNKFGWVPQSVLANMYQIPRSTLALRLQNIRIRIDSDPQITLELEKALAGRLAA